MHKQTLGFEVRIARDAIDLRAACGIRSIAYGHHTPGMRTVCIEPDMLDADENTAVLLCVDKATGAAVGTARLQTNAAGPLLIEYSVGVPDSMRTDTRVEISRLSAIPGADPLVKLALMKACYLFSVANQIRWMVIGARKDSLVRQYTRLGFEDLYGDERRVQLMHAGRLEHRVLAFNVTTAESRWRETRHPLYVFMVDTVHPDIRLFSTQVAMPARIPISNGRRPPLRMPEEILSLRRVSVPAGVPARRALAN